LRYAVANVPFYDREPYRTAARELSGLSDLAALPVLSKEDVRSNIAALKPRITPRHSTTVHTSGTTGAGLVFPATVEQQQEQWAVWWRYRRWHGLALDTWSAHFGGRNISPRGGAPWRIDYAQRRLLLSAYHTNSQYLAAIVDVLRQRRPRWLHGYPSFIALVARHLLSRGEDLGYQVRWITTGAENLLVTQRAVIRAAFAVEPVEHYGLTEGNANISECPCGELHVDEDFAAVEFIDGTIVGTSFTNPAFPLIRYTTGDLGRLSNRRCRCGRPGRIVESIDGRLDDYIVLSDGSRLGRLDHIFKDAVGVASAQFVQERTGFATLRIVPGPGFNALQIESIKTEMTTRVQQRLDLTIEVVEALETSLVAKSRLVVRRDRPLI
jgi:phenylacetate-CoA ligase